MPRPDKSTLAEITEFSGSYTGSFRREINAVASCYAKRAPIVSIDPGMTRLDDRGFIHRIALIVPKAHARARFPERTPPLSDWRFGDNSA